VAYVYPNLDNDRKIENYSRAVAEVEVEVEVNLLSTVSRPVCLGVGRPSGTRNQFFFFLEIFFRQ
jgi:hypothetical protein